MQPISLTRAPHHEQIAFAGHEYEIIWRGAGGNAFDHVGQWGASSDHEGSALAKHHNRDQGVVEPTHLAIAVQTLEVLSAAVQDRCHTLECLAICCRQM